MFQPSTRHYRICSVLRTQEKLTRTYKNRYCQIFSKLNLVKDFSARTNGVLQNVSEGPLELHNTAENIIRKLLTDHPSNISRLEVIEIIDLP